MKSNPLRVLVVFFVLFFLLSLILGTVLFFFTIQERKVPQDTYLFTKFSPFFNSTVSGIASISKKLSKFETIHYSYGDSYVVISNFGTKKYSCGGSCMCEEERRFASASVLRSGIVFVISAFSTGMAIHFAQEYFRTRCLSDFGGECLGLVNIEVENCEKIDEEIIDGANDLWECKGHCLLNPDVKDYQSERDKIDVDGDGDGDEQKPKFNSEFFEGVCKEMDNFGIVEFKTKSPPTDESRFEVEKIFRNEYMVPFCISSSKQGYERKTSLCYAGEVSDANVFCKPWL